MARFDIYPNPGHTKKSDVPYLLAVQSDLLSALDSRVVVPMRRVDRFDKVILPKNLAPVFEIDGLSCFMETAKLAAVPAKILHTPVATLADHHADIMAALDFLFQGY
ncbi:MAG: CcdB family protein [Sideroxydans sp.]|nr:CcdB family protein [Sideroxydans sp.]